LNLFLIIEVPLTCNYAKQHKKSKLVDNKQKGKKGNLRRRTWNCCWELCGGWKEEFESLALSSARANTLLRSNLELGTPNLFLQEEEEEETKKGCDCDGEDWIVWRGWDESLEFRECWNIDKCVPIENVAICSGNWSIVSNSNRVEDVVGKTEEND
jgi:hypothetical protein